MARNEQICVGMIAGAHGIRGQVKLRSFTEDPESIFSYKPITDETGAREFKFKREGISKDSFIASLKDVPDRNGAEALRGTKLFVTRAKLPKAKKGEYYEADLIGLAARDEAGKGYGTVLGVHDYGAGVMLEIGKTKKDSFMLPFNAACAPEVDIAAGFVLIAVPDGWLDKSKQE